MNTDCRDFRHSDHWRFSSETALRIPELIHELFHRLHWHDLEVLRELQPVGSPIRTDFVRRVLDKPDDKPEDKPDKKLSRDIDSPRSYQFTYSNLFAQISAGGRDAEAGMLEEGSKEAKALFDDIKNGALPGWKQALIAFVKENRDKSDHVMVERLDKLTPDIFSGEGQDVIFRNLTLLYEFYSRIPLTGYSIGLLDKEYFENGKDSFKQGCPNTLAYLIQVSYNQAIIESGESHRIRDELPPIKAFWRIDYNGNAHNLVPLADEDLKQPPGTFFPSVSDTDVDKTGFEKIHYRLWKVFNSTTSDRPPEHILASTTSNRPPEHILAIPIYPVDDLQPNARPQESKPLMTQGAFLGWFFLSFPEGAYKTARRVLNFPQKNKNADSKPNWVSKARTLNLKSPKANLAVDLRRIRHVLNEFSDRYLLGEMEWALERDFKDGQTALEFTVDHFHHCGGWVGEPLGTRQPPEEIQFCYALYCREDADAKTLIPVFTEKDGWIPDTVSHLVVNVTHSKDSASLGHAGSQIVCLRRRSDTALSNDAEHAREYGHRVAKSARRMYESALLIHHRQQVGRQRGESVTFHDYSKDLNALDIQVKRYADEVMMVKDALLGKREDKHAGLSGLIEHLENTALSSEGRELVAQAKEQAKRLGVPAFDFLLRLRFMMDHLRTRTEGRFYGSPQWCLNFIESGTKRDIYLLVNALVWLPLGWYRFEEMRKALPEQSVEDPFTWARVFAFEEPNSLERTVGRRSIGDILSQFFKSRITLEQFGDAFPPPILNRENDWADQVMWAGLHDIKNILLRRMAARDLLPLLVFSLRAAYQHAYLKTILQASDVMTVDSLPKGEREDIRMTACEKDSSKDWLRYRIEIDFPDPEADPALSSEVEASLLSLPYGDWHEQMDHYRNKVHPWEWQLYRVPGPVSETGRDPWHYRILLTSEALHPHRESTL